MKQILLLTLSLISAFYVGAQSFFDIDVVHKVEIDFFDEDWDHQLDSLASLGVGTGSGSGRILAHVTLDGTPFDSCGVRYKGNSSMDTASNKNPFNIDLNYVIPGQEYQGKDKIKLANCFTDPAMVREALTYEIANQYMDCPRASFVELYIEGEYRGIYTNTESIDNEFLNANYGSSNNPFFKCDPVSFELYGDNSNLAFQPDSMAYDTLYDMKSDYGLAELQTLTYQLEFAPETIENYLDVDRTLWFLAVSSAFVHNDGYTAFAHNFYIYKMDNGKWSIILWDVNMSFGGLLWNGTNLLPLGIDALQNQDPYLHADAYDFRPLIAHLLSNPKYKRMYTAHYKTILEENVSNGLYLERAETMHDLIDDLVEDEPYNPYSYADFNTNLYNDVGFWVNLRPGLENLMEARETYLSSLPEFGFTQPTIDEITVFPTDPTPYTTANFTAVVEDANLVQFAYRYNEFDSFIYEDMFDDGLHEDGAAGDGIYGVEIPILPADLMYYIYAENPNAGKFSPVRAAYEYYTLTPFKGLVINELSAANVSIVADEDGDFDDWIELYNNTDESIHLEGYYLSDNAGNLMKWSFPDVAISAGGYLIIWADGDSTHTSGLHTNFKLSAAGEVLSLSDNTGQLIDQIDFPAQFDDITFGRLANGIGEFTFLIPTFNAENSTMAGLAKEKIPLENLTVYPNPAHNQVTISYPVQQTTTLRLYNLNGKLILTKTLTNEAETQLDVSHLDPGIYTMVDSQKRFFKLVIQ